MTMKSRITPTIEPARQPPIGVARSRALLPRRAASAVTALSAALLLLAALAPLAGCNIVGPVIAVAAGPGDVDPIYKLDKKKTHVIFLDDRRPAIPSRSIRDLVTRTADQRLLEERVLTELIDSRLVAPVVARERAGSLMSVEEIGRAVQAQVVIYVWVDSFALTRDGQSYSPFAELRVRIIDAQSGERLHPPPVAAEGSGDPASWHVLSIAMAGQQGAPPTTGAELERAQQDFAKVVGVKIAQLFYKHEVTEGKTPARLDKADQR